MPDDPVPANDVVDAVTAPVEPTETEAHEILSEAIEGAQTVADNTFEAAHDVRTEAEHEAERINDNAGDAVDRVGILSTVREALDAHIAEHHSVPAVEEPSEESHEAAVTIDVPPLDEIAPDVAESGGDGDSVTVSRRRRILRRR